MSKKPWRRCDGAPGDRCPVGWAGQRIQIRPIGSNQAKIMRGDHIDWSQKFEFRFIQKKVKK